jgi:hypothetical protein
LSEADKEELKEYGIPCGYQPGSMLFGGVDEEILGCIRDRAGAKIIGTVSKSVGFPKLEFDIIGTVSKSVDFNISSAAYSIPIAR